MSLILVTGGARAGKSDFAQGLAQRLGGDHDVCFLATAEAGDDDMRLRIDVHRASRPFGWRTIEAPRCMAAALQSIDEAPPRSSVVLLDCVTLLVSNVLLSQSDWAEGRAEAWPAVKAEIDAVIRFAEKPGTLVAVTNEVGLGIVPDNGLARRYRDLLGRANQRLASAADSVYLVVSGIPLAIKGASHA